RAQQPVGGARDLRYAGQLEASADQRPRRELVTHVKDRPGHDRRYAIDDTKIARELGWQPRVAFEEGIRATVQWYLHNPEWVESVTSGSYRQWVAQQYEVLATAA